MTNKKTVNNDNLLRGGIVLLAIFLVAQLSQLYLLFGLVGELNEIKQGQESTISQVYKFITKPSLSEIEEVQELSFFQRFKDQIYSLVTHEYTLKFLCILGIGAALWYGVPLLPLNEISSFATTNYNAAVTQVTSSYTAVAGVVIASYTAVASGYTSVASVVTASYTALASVVTISYTVVASVVTISYKCVCYVGTAMFFGVTIVGKFFQAVYNLPGAGLEALTTITQWFTDYFDSNVLYWLRAGFRGMGYMHTALIIWYESYSEHFLNLFLGTCKYYKDAFVSSYQLTNTWLDGVISTPIYNLSGSLIMYSFRTMKRILVPPRRAPLENNEERPIEEVASPIEEVAFPIEEVAFPIEDVESSLKPIIFTFPYDKLHIDGIKRLEDSLDVFLFLGL